MDECNQKAPDPEAKKKELKIYTFTRAIHNEQVTPEKPSANVVKEQNEGTINLTIDMILYEEEIEICAKGIKENFKVPTVQYEKTFSFEEVKNFNKFFALLKIYKIFEVFQKSFEQKYDMISQKEEELQIKLMVNFMDVMTEEISFSLPKIKLTNQDELESLKETIKYLDNERNALKEQVKSLNNSLQEIKVKLEENNNFKINEEKQFQNKIDQKGNELQNKIEEVTNAHQKKENELQNKIEEVTNAHQIKENELQNKIDENKNELQNKMDENKNELQNKMDEKEQKLQNKMDEAKMNSKIK